MPNKLIDLEKPFMKWSCKNIKTESDEATNLYKMHTPQSKLNDITGDGQQNTNSGTTYRRIDLFVFSTNKL